ncbi:MAG: hypothetical protein L6R42_002987, partial [Xanthoria sp. 1 TBL-2021]
EIASTAATRASSVSMDSRSQTTDSDSDSDSDSDDDEEISATMEARAFEILSTSIGVGFRA